MTEQQQGTKNLLTSRFVERALGYSWIKYGWETATKTYDTIKQSNRLTRYGCELAEVNASKVVHSNIVEGTIHFLAPLIVVADEFGVRQLDKVDKGTELVQRNVVAPVAYTYNAVTSLPSCVLDRAEALVDYFLPEEKHGKGDEGPAAGQSPRGARKEGRSVPARTFDLTLSTLGRIYSRLGYENLKTQVTEKLHSHETLNDLIIYFRTSDPEKKEKLVKQGRDLYWHFRTNYKAIFIQAARSVVQPYLVIPALKLYNLVCSLWDRTLKRILLRGPFSPNLARPAANNTA